MNRIAECACGEVTLEVEGDPKLHMLCNCNDCKKRTGSAFGVSAYFSDSQIKSNNGKTLIYEISNDETEQLRYFCKSCGTTLYWKIFKFPGISGISDMTGIASGCFTQNPLPAPTLSASNNNKCAWLTLPDIKVDNLRKQHKLPS
jgi:hypothetical protein